MYSKVNTLLNHRRKWNFRSGYFVIPAAILTATQGRWFGARRVFGIDTGSAIVCGALRPKGFLSIKAQNNGAGCCSSLRCYLGIANQPPIWLWHINIHLTGGLPMGSANDIDTAKADFKAAGEELKAKTSPEDLAAGHECSGRRVRWLPPRVADHRNLASALRRFAPKTELRTRPTFVQIILPACRPAACRTGDA